MKNENKEMMTVYFPVNFSLDATEPRWFENLWTSGVHMVEAHLTTTKPYAVSCKDMFDEAIKCYGAEIYRVQESLRIYKQVQIPYDNDVLGLKHPSVVFDRIQQFLDEINKSE